MGQATQGNWHDAWDANDAALPSRDGGARDAKVLGKLGLGFAIAFAELLDVRGCGALVLHEEVVRVVQ